MMFAKQNIFRLILLFFLCSGLIPVWAQYNRETFSNTKNEFPGEKVVELNKTVVYEISENKGKLEIIVRSNESYIYLKDVSVMGVKHSVYSSEIYTLMSYEAAIYTPQNGTYKKTNIREKKEISNNLQCAFYDDLHEYSIDYGNINEGTIVELNTVHKVSDPHFMHSVFISEYIPVKTFSLKFIADKNVSLKLIPQHLSQVSLDYICSETKNSTIYAWTGNHIDAVEIEEFTPDDKYYVAHIIPVIERYSLEGQTVNVLNTVNDLYGWYYTFIDELVDEAVKPEIKALADSIVSNSMSEIEKVEKIYYWVQSNIKYIAFEYGMGGFIPRNPSDILRNRYGDCKDKSCLIYSLLKAVGVESHFTWIGTNSIPYTYNEVSAPVTDNHMIITYINNGTYYFLDGTSNNLPIDIPSSFIQGKEALISLTKDTYAIEKVPVLPSTSNTVFDSINISIASRQVSGSGTIEVNGYPYYFFHDRYVNKDNIDKKETVKNYLEKGSNKFILDGYKITSMPEFEKTGNLDYNFTLGDYVKTIDHEIYLNLNMERSLSDFRIDDKRKYPIFFEYTANYNFEAVLEIPEGYKIEFIPTDKKYENPDFGYSIKYTLNDNKLIYEHNHYRNTLMIGYQKLTTWKEFINKLENDYKETVLLKKHQP